MDVCRLFRNVCYRLFIRRIRHRLIICLLLISCLCIVSLYDFIRSSRRTASFKSHVKNYNTTSFPLLVNALQNQNCVQPYLDPYHPSVINFFHKVPKLKCETEPDWLLVRNGFALVQPEAEQKHGIISCQMVPLLRGRSDFTVRYGKKEQIKNRKSKVPSDFIKTSCKSNSGQRYMNVHSTISYSQSIFDRLERLRKEAASIPKLSVIMLGFDSVSRNTWMRMLPSSYSYFKNNLKGVILEGYNIVGDGTPQALLPILTGKTEEELPEARKGHQGATFVDDHPWIWNEFSRLGYVTQWGEDMAYIGTFNLRMTGFKNQPVDHYMRPYYLVTEKLHPFFKPYCLGSQPRHRIMFNYLKDFIDMYKGYPKFSFLFHSEYSHGDSNNLQWADLDFTYLLKYLFDNGHLNSTVLILMSDHGARFHGIRQTLQGKYEERMPFFAFRFPEWFSKVYTEEDKNLRINSNRLVTPFDIHATFQHIIKIASPLQSNESLSMSINKKSRNLSILGNIPKNRSCYEAGIAPHWCACLPWKYNNVDNAIVRRAVDYVINFINSLTEDFRHLCGLLSVFKIIRALTFNPSAEVVQYTGSVDKDGREAKFNTSLSIPTSMLQVTFQASPGEAVYEATVIYDRTFSKFVLNDREISRTNPYGSSADCITNLAPNLRQYCFCK